jgi:[CysO sulfur-carrier protein]-thiocarboxylate-dependent cysteine synthase
MRAADEMQEGTIVVLLADSGWKYLSTGIYDRDLDELQDELERSLLW